MRGDRCVNYAVVIIVCVCEIIGLCTLKKFSHIYPVGMQNYLSYMMQMGLPNGLWDPFSNISKGRFTYRGHDFPS